MEKKRNLCHNIAMRFRFFISILYASLLFSTISCRYNIDSNSRNENIRNILIANELSNRALSFSLPIYKPEQHTLLSEKKSQKYLVLMYLAGDFDRNIEAALINNMPTTANALAANPYSSNIKTVALFDGRTSGSSYWYDKVNEISTKGSFLLEINANSTCTKETPLIEYTTDVSSKADFMQSEINSGSYITFQNFLSWAESEYNSDQSYSTIVITGSHGSGSYGTKSAKNLYSMCPDYNSGTFIYTNEISLALKNAGYGTDKKIDLLIYDVCLCGTVEDAYEVKDYANGLISSVNETPIAGINYDVLFKSITPQNSLLQIGRNVCSAFAQTYRTQTKLRTIAFSDLTNISSVAKSTSSLSDYITANPQYASIFDGTIHSYLKVPSKLNSNDCIYYECTYWINIRDSVRQGTTFYSFDFGYLADKVYDYAQEKNDAKLSQICSTLKDDLEKVIVCSWRGTGYPNYLLEGSYPSFNSTRNYYGLSIVGITTGENRPYRDSTFAFNTDTTWNALLEMLYP